MTIAEYVDTYTPQFPLWERECGGLTTGMMFEMAKKLGIACDLQVFRGQERLGLPRKNGHQFRRL
jgi:hypothetical protein